MIICCLLCSLNAAAQEQEPIDSLITQASKPSLMERLHQAQQYLDDKAKAKVEPSTGPTSGFNVVVGNMSDSAIDINVKQMVLVAERVAYFDRTKEAIYDALTAAGITIAFPQCDVHLIHE